MEDISNIIKNLIKKYNDVYHVPTRYISDGECMPFARELYKVLVNIGIETKILDNTQFDKGLLNVKDYGIKPKDYDKIGLPDHYWIYYNNKHYDSDVPYGVSDMFELPHIKKFYMKEKNESVKYKMITLFEHFLSTMKPSL